ncbi:MAG: CoA-binding protein [Gemmatimonadota bacterium]|nr:CoA-binding protein [Gemmatimonadota bacterium]MDH4347654.1 CoA-binding protein [Gemmatimonadota bacterium]
MPRNRDRIGAILREATTIAVVGLSPDPSRPSHGVARYLQRAGYRVIPVRPGNEKILGERAFPDLGSAQTAAGPIDIVNIFRRSEAVPELLPDLLAVRPRLVWMQVGVEHPATAALLEEAGIPVVMDRCLMVDHAEMVAA